MKIRMKLPGYCLAFFFLLAGCRQPAPYQPAPSPLMTRFAALVDPERPLPEYPRPQMERTAWLSLNGLWDYTLQPVDFAPVQGLTTADSWTTHPIPSKWRGKILVPFAIDAPLSGVGHILRHDEVLWYRRTFTVPASWQGQRVVLHFQASDWETSVYVNGEKVGQHRGGYDPFSFDITSQLVKGENELHVCVWDATENQSQAIGKQIMPENRQGFRYQPTGGIWQTVWLEPVPENAIERIKIVPQYDEAQVKLTLTTTNGTGEISARVLDGDRLVAEMSGPAEADIVVPVAGFKSWSPDNPFLYDLVVTLRENGQNTDEVKSYFGMRKMEVRTAPDGFRRLYLNNEAIFQYGPLDQGYWPDGVLTPPSEEAIRYDLEYLKKIGCNMVRVHIKTHPDRWYYWADKLGLLVWQDMICMPKYGQTVDEPAARQWQTELQAMVDWLHNHPSIVQWVIFNEGWSQHNTEFYADRLGAYDPTRILNPASGWDDYPAGDVMDVHDYTFYPRNNAADYKRNGQRALVIGEAAGINLAIPGHTWYSESNPPEQDNHQNFIPVDKYSFQEEAGRHTYGSPEVFEEAYRKFIESVRCLNAGSGCNALVYTQITDVEHELNGWLTYDREISKIDPEVMRAINETLYDPPVLETILPFMASWKLDGSKNIRLPIGEDNSFIPAGVRQKPPYTIETTFQLEDLTPRVVVAVKGFTDSEIYLNGRLFRKTRLAARFGEPGVNFYPVYPEEMELLKMGENVIRVQTEKPAEVDLLDVAVYSYE